MYFKVLRERAVSLVLQRCEHPRAGRARRHCAHWPACAWRDAGRAPQWRRPMRSAQRPFGLMDKACRLRVRGLRARALQGGGCYFLRCNGFHLLRCFCGRALRREGPYFKFLQKCAASLMLQRFWPSACGAGTPPHSASWPACAGRETAGAPQWRRPIRSARSPRGPNEQRFFRC